MTTRMLKVNMDALAALGLSREEFDLYDMLLQRPGATLVDIVNAGSEPAAHMAELLKRLERKGLVVRSPERLAHYRALAPDLGIGALIARRQRGLEAAQVLAEQLSKKKPPDEFEDELTVELIIGRDALTRVIEHIYSNVQHEIMEFDRAPYFNSYEQHMIYMREVIARGASFRTIVDADVINMQGRMRCAYESAKEGEQTRLLKGVPIKAAIIDRRLALLPLHLKDARESGLLLRPSLLLDLLCAHFDMLWHQATPLDEQAAGDDRDAGANDLEHIVMLLASGLKDKAVAHHMGLSARTLERRLCELQKQLHADSRFQAGWKAALRSLEKR